MAMTSTSPIGRTWSCGVLSAMRCDRQTDYVEGRREPCGRTYGHFVRRRKSQCLEKNRGLDRLRGILYAEIQRIVHSPAKKPIG